MFDGVDLITLPMVHIGRSLALYRDVLGFSEVDRGPMAEPVAWQELWGLPAPPSRFVLLGKPGSAGGWLRPLSRFGTVTGIELDEPSIRFCRELDLHRTLVGRVDALPSVAPKSMT